MIPEGFMDSLTSYLNDEIIDLRKSSADIQDEIAKLQGDYVRIQNRLDAHEKHLQRLQQARGVGYELVMNLERTIQQILLLEPGELYWFISTVFKLLKKYNNSSCKVGYCSPLALPSLPLAERANLPNCSAVYFVFSNTQILYIGKAVNLSKRWIQHHLYSEIEKVNNVRIAWLKEAEANLADTEARCIAYFKPLLNNTPPLKQSVSNGNTDLT